MFDTFPRRDLAAPCKTQLSDKHMRKIWQNWMLFPFSRVQHISSFRAQVQMSSMPGVHTWPRYKDKTNLKDGSWVKAWQSKPWSPWNLPRWMSGNALQRAHLMNFNSSPLQSAWARQNRETQCSALEVWQRYQKQTLPIALWIQPIRPREPDETSWQHDWS